MNKLDKIPALRKLANQKKTPLVDVNFNDPKNLNGVTFTYTDGDVEIVRKYGDPDWGIEEELKRLRKL